MARRWDWAVWGKREDFFSGAGAAAGGGAVDAEHGAEGGELEPAGKEFLVGGVLGVGVAVAFIGEEAAGVGVPVGDAGGGEVEAGGDLTAEGVPVAGDVSGPGDGGVALLAGVGGAGEEDDAFTVGEGALALVDAGGVHERVGVEDLCAGAGGGLEVAELAPFSGEFGFGGVEPPAVDAEGEEFGAELLPVESAAIGIEGVVPFSFAGGEDIGDGGVEEGAGFFEFVEVVGVEIELGPDGDEVVEVKVVELFECGGGVGVGGIYRRRGSPRCCRPISASPG